MNKMAPATKTMVIDGKGHLLGRLASVVAKTLLNGNKVVVVRCEHINVGGPLSRNKAKFDTFLRMKSNTNPRKSSKIHYRAPSRMFWRTVRGMIPNKTPRGAAALERLTVCDGVPAKFDKKKRLVVPSALKVMKMKPNRDVTRLGEVSTRVGWKYGELVSRLEEERGVASTERWQKRVQWRSAHSQAKEKANAKIPAEHKALLERVGML